MQVKRALLIAGGGTLGTYTAKELLRLGHKVDAICLEDKISDNKNLTYIKAKADDEYLKNFLANKHYDGIVNFIHYNEPEDYEPIHAILTEHTDHLIFLSSYRVYSNANVVTENTPFLLDVVKDDEKFIQTEKYAISKARCEKFLRNNNYKKNFTIVRPVISFSSLRFDLIMTSGREILDAAKNNKPIILPSEAKRFIAGLDWAGNTGKIIANLMFKKECIGEAYTITSAQNVTWEEVADYYTQLTGCKFEWKEKIYPHEDYRWTYDRAYNRKIDNNKVLKATGLVKGDFTPIKEGIKIELKKVGFIK